MLFDDSLHQLCVMRQSLAVLALLPNKSATIYKRLIDAVQRIAANLNLVFQPPEVMMDFEAAMLSAIEDKFRSGTRIRGCYFHYAQSIWRKVQNLGQTCEFRTNASFQKFVRRLIALAIAPYDEIDDLWIKIQDDVQFLSPMDTRLST